MEKLEPMFTHMLKDKEVFVLSYKLREDKPKISVRITADEKECRWVPMKGEENFKPVHGSVSGRDGGGDLVHPHRGAHRSMISVN